MAAGGVSLGGRFQEEKAAPPRARAPAMPKVVLSTDKESEPPAPEAAPHRYLSLTLAYSERKRGRWSPKRLSSSGLRIERNMLWPPRSVQAPPSSSQPPAIINIPPPPRVNQPAANPKPAEAPPPADTPPHDQPAPAAQGASPGTASDPCWVATQTGSMLRPAQAPQPDL